MKKPKIMTYENFLATIRAYEEKGFVFTNSVDIVRTQNLTNYRYTHTFVKYDGKNVRYLSSVEAKNHFNNMVNGINYLKAAGMFNLTFSDGNEELVFCSKMSDVNFVGNTLATSRNIEFIDYEIIQPIGAIINKTDVKPIYRDNSNWDGITHSYKKTPTLFGWEVFFNQEADLKKYLPRLQKSKTLMNFLNVIGKYELYEISAAINRYLGLQGMVDYQPPESDEEYFKQTLIYLLTMSREEIGERTTRYYLEEMQENRLFNGKVN